MRDAISLRTRQNIHIPYIIDCRVGFRSVCSHECHDVIRIYDNFMRKITSKRSKIRFASRLTYSITIRSSVDRKQYYRDAAQSERKINKQNEENRREKVRIRF